jgi:hypothetical protein
VRAYRDAVGQRVQQLLAAEARAGAGGEKDGGDFQSGIPGRRV